MARELGRHRLPTFAQPLSAPAALRPALRDAAQLCLETSPTDLCESRAESVHKSEPAEHNTAAAQSSGAAAQKQEKIFGQAKAAEAAAAAAAEAAAAAARLEAAATLNALVNAIDCTSPW